MTDKMEEQLAAGIEEDIGLKQMAAKLSPRSIPPYDQQMPRHEGGGLYSQPPNPVPVQKRLMSPVERFDETIAKLLKVEEEVRSLRDRLLGKGDAKASTTAPPDKEHATVPAMRAQADIIIGIGNRISVLVAEIRGAF